MQASIRRVAATDWPEMKRTRLAALGTDRMAFGSTLEAERAFGDDVWIDRARVSATSADRATYVAFDSDGRMVGMLGAHLDGQGAKLFGTWVDPAARGRGIGGQLLDAVLAWVETSHPSMSISLSVNPAFESAVRLYKSRGFERTGTGERIDHDPTTYTEILVRRRG